MMKVVNNGNSEEKGCDSPFFYAVVCVIYLFLEGERKSQESK